MNIQQTILLSTSTLLIFSSLLNLGLAQTDPLQTKCSSEFQKLTACLEFATAKADTPSSSCCTSVTDIRKSDAACLCYIIQQANSGQASIKSLGVQLPRLLQLPTACKLVNASVSDCPKLLKLPAGSPDSAIFTNNTSGAAATTATVTNSPTTTAKTGPTSDGLANQVNFIGTITISVVSAIFFSMIPFGA
ncbi:hypothetical protein QJS10_CPA16g00918 [Acorus calamus]|uniref:Bifunctional inhibitor/plant lipid transfer protein/seed storage helical domain-containing protein n=1 Tax=Acorus calamus TaxID=4465 RepID=A0AAV9CY10_ACOCL|nr:hypothetical protein QJS10_CPA16g00918 [Acorus calamus]